MNENSLSVVAYSSLLNSFQCWNLKTGELFLLFYQLIPTSMLHRLKTLAVFIIQTTEQSRKQTGLLGKIAACIQARSCCGSAAERQLSSDRTECRKGRVISAVAVFSDPHSSRPSYIKELLRDIIRLQKPQSKHLSWRVNLRGTDFQCVGLPIHSILHVELDHSFTMKFQALKQTFIHSKRPD